MKIGKLIHNAARPAGVVALSVAILAGVEAPAHALGCTYRMICLYDRSNYEGGSFVTPKDYPDYTPYQFTDGEPLNDNTASLKNLDENYRWRGFQHKNYGGWAFHVKRMKECGEGCIKYSQWPSLPDTGPNPPKNAISSHNWYKP
ncbi:peptidase inhibitor family I36 protein [Streptomyces sp. NRRL F-5755]|uniref:peptidase inhibitor family I36 protein n=1 Tax=Streptomyces sp. NRRL F-5755 TaxID=1519475 RepID=UPI00099BDF40|nr:peptidase inhibitor family I36 protein [Streptomyces sp. NRRL F-5755]